MLHKLNVLSWLVVEKFSKGGVAVYHLDYINCHIVPKYWVVVI